MKLKLKVSFDEAKKALRRIANTPGTENFGDGFDTRWKQIDAVEGGKPVTRPTIMAFCWLYCWVEDKNPTHQRAQKLAAETWNNIVNIPSESIINKQLFLRMAQKYKDKDQEQASFIDDIDNLLPTV